MAVVKPFMCIRPAAAEEATIEKLRAIKGVLRVRVVK